MQHDEGMNYCSEISNHIDSELINDMSCTVKMSTVLIMYYTTLGSRMVMLNVINNGALV